MKIALAGALGFDSANSEMAFQAREMFARGRKNQEN
jgi:hypothetical protein